jgi:hypothetical protein
MARVLGAVAALFAGLWLLRTAPIVAVLVVLGAMSYALISAARLCAAERAVFARPMRLERSEKDGKYEN